LFPSDAFMILRLLFHQLKCPEHLSLLITEVQ
jgi:hypothetical protein